MLSVFCWAQSRCMLALQKVIMWAFQQLEDVAKRPHWAVSFLKCVSKKVLWHNMDSMCNTPTQVWVKHDPTELTEPSEELPADEVLTDDVTPLTALGPRLNLTSPHGRDFVAVDCHYYISNPSSFGHVLYPSLLVIDLLQPQCVVCVFMLSSPERASECTGREMCSSQSVDHISVWKEKKLFKSTGGFWLSLVLWVLHFSLLR